MAEGNDRPREQPDALGGNGNSAPAQSNSQDVNKLGKFLERGEEILDTFTASIRAFEGQTLQIKTLAASVSEIQASLKRKSPISEADALTKKPRTDVSESDSDDSSDSEVDAIMRGTSNSQIPSEQHSLIHDMDDFFTEETNVGDDINTQVASMVNKNLRRPKFDKQKIKSLHENYKRPGNVESLQVPKVDNFLWNQLKNHIKSADVSKQQMIDCLNKTATPLVMAINHCHDNPQPDISVLKQCIGDCFKIVCASITKINAERREAIKQVLEPRFKSLCSSDKPVSASGLFGDDLQEQSKQLDTSKQIQMTTRGPFLGQGRRNSLTGRQFPQAPQTSQMRHNMMPPSTNQQRKAPAPWPTKQSGTRFGPSGRNFGKRQYGNIQKKH